MMSWISPKKPDKLGVGIYMELENDHNHNRRKPGQKVRT